jgi:Asp/Glu/hydantoin racemase
MTRIALIHATPVAVEPVSCAFQAGWPEAFVTNLLDDSLSPDYEKTGHLDEPMTERFRALGRYVADAGADAIMFTCSAFGPAIDAVAMELAPKPVLKPNEAMFEEALLKGGRVGMLATFKPSVSPMKDEFAAMARVNDQHVSLECIWVEGAMDALRAGDTDTHNRLIAEAAADLSDCDTVMLAHFSTAKAKPDVVKVLDCPVLSSPDSAVKKLKTMFDPSGATES